MIENYINPLIGDMKIQSITTRTTDKFVQELQKTKAVGSAFRPNKDGKPVSDRLVLERAVALTCSSPRDCMGAVRKFSLAPHPRGIFICEAPQSDCRMA